MLQPGKTSWNLEPWRPVVDDTTMIGSGCNPGGSEERFLMPGRPTRDQVAALVDHTLLKPEATAAEVAAVAAEAAALGVYAVCVSPSMVPDATAAGVRVAAVAGFPSGKHLPEIKAREAA